MSAIPKLALLLLVIPAQCFAYDEYRGGSVEGLVVMFLVGLFWVLPTLALGQWAGAKWGVKGTRLDKPIEPLMNMLKKGEELYGRLAKRTPKDAEPEPYSLASYLGDVMFIFYAAWRVVLFAVFWPVGLFFLSLWIFYFFGYYILFGGFDFGAEKGRAE